ncbi:MAG: SDR family oxidoreductase [Pirellulaceae bacterium]|nr:SDR family oxidoreductase [Pirellulaceae bacterium]
MTTQVYAEAEYRLLPDTDHRALIVGGTSLTQAVAVEFARRGIASAIVDDGTFDARQVQDAVLEQRGVVHVLDQTGDAHDLIHRASRALDGLTSLVNICMPNPRDPLTAIMSYPDGLLSRNLSAIEYMSATGGGSIVNHCALPVMYAGGELEDYVSSLRGAVTGVVRSMARKYGRQNIRCVGVQTGMLDLPEVHAWASEAVKAVDVPVKRWGTATECAKLITFLAIDASYITGQILILDGGMTAGLSGT